MVGSPLFRWIALGLGLLLAGCEPGPGRPPIVRFPDGGPVAFSPDGKSALVARPGRLVAYDLTASREVWSHPIAQPEIGLSFSPSGTFVILVEQTDEAHPAALSLLRAADGERTFAHPFAQTAVHQYDVRKLLFVKLTSNKLAASDDGAFVAAAFDDDRIEVRATADGRIVYTESRVHDLDRVAFERGSSRLAIGGGTYTPPRVVKIVDPGRGTWSVVATFDDAFRPAWTRAGLGFAGEHGLDIWDGHARRAVVPKLPWDPGFRFSEDGVYVALWEQGTAASEYAVYRVADGQRLFLEGGDRKVIASRAVWQAGFDGPSFHAFLRSGDVVTVSLSGTPVLRRVSFGAPGSSTPALFTDGVQWHDEYTETLSPYGPYIDIFHQGEGHEIYSTVPAPP